MMTDMEMSANGIDNRGFDASSEVIGKSKPETPPELPVEIVAKETPNELPEEHDPSFTTYQPSPSKCTKREQAICVRNAYKHYGSNKHPNHVLENLNMTVTKGAIYVLLGASGCGKTTLLSCLVGRRRLDSGEIWVLGGKPGAKDTGVPGHRVGYMPQEIALAAEFTICETMMYFGWIFKMRTEDIQKRLDFLLEFLDLPDQNRLIKNLSGGQQRRVSFAVALLHDPELIVLDEPTVGVDPLLRQSIWSYLIQITKGGNKTVIITTHYIEEARQAHCIGLMRNGKLLAEASPNYLLSTYNSKSLEEVFLMLCRSENDSSPLNSTKSSLATLHRGSKKANSVYISEEGGIIGLNFHKSEEVTSEVNGYYNPVNMYGKVASNNRWIDWDCSYFSPYGKMRALLQKNFLTLWRNIGVMIIIFVLPALNAISFCLTIGLTPRNIHLAIVNEELNTTAQGTSVYKPYCTLEKEHLFSCRYISMIPDIYLQDYYETLDEALEAVKMGNAWGAILFPPDFSEFLKLRIYEGNTADDVLLDISTIRVWMDMSNQPIGLMIKKDLQYTFRNFSEWLLPQYNKSEKLADIPLQYLDPILGSSDASFTDFMAPGVIAAIIFFLAVALTSSLRILERMEGLTDRSWVAGVSPTDLLISHILTQFVVMCGQTFLILFFMFLVFGLTCVGNIFWVAVVALLLGFSGMSYGFFLASVCEEERTATQLAIASFYPLLLLCGVSWPVEGSPVVVRYIAYGLPLTLGTNALKSITSRGWGIDQPDVYQGFIGTLATITVFLTLSLMFARKDRA